MNEERRKRGFAYSKTLMTAAICALFLSGGSVMAHAAAAPVAQEQQQTTNVTVTVVDSKGEPIIGANVVEKGTTNGTITDVSGKAALNVKKGATLQVSFVGFKTQEVKAQGSLRVVLRDDNELLDEVVVVGYGTQKKANLTGAVSTVDVSKTMEGRPQTDVMKALQGAVPGLTITNNSGDINGSASIEIRGVGSINGTLKPLYIVDGVSMSDISFLNPEDIEDISVLKDAASASIYGSRAAGGVIMLKTKTAKTQDRVSIKYSNNFSWSNATYLPDYGTVPSQIKALSQANKRAGLANELFGMYLDTMLPYAEAWEQQNGGKKAGYREMRPFKSMSDVGDYYVNPDGSGAMYYANWDVQDIMFQTAPSQTHNLSVSGSTGKANYYLAFGYSEKEGQMNFNPDKLQRYNVNANFNVALTNWLETGFRFNFVNKTYDMPNRWRNTYTYMWRWGSFFGPYGYMLDANGTPVDGVNGIAYQKQAGNDHDVTSFTRINSYIKAKILDGLTFQADFTYDLTNRNNEYAYIPVYVFNTWGGNISEPYYGVSQSATYQTQTNTKVGRWTTNIFGSYEKTFNEDHNMKVMAGFTADKEQNRYFSAKRTALNDNDLPELNLATGTQTVTSSASHWATAGFFGRINYDYKGIYLLEANARYDTSSRFPADKQWGFFPSVSAGYRFSEEAFFEPLKDVISNGKLRASWGEIGNDNVGSNRFISTISTIAAGSSYWISGDSKLPMANMPSLVSSDLGWERVRTLDIGLDLGFLDNSLNIGLDWFQRDTKDLIAPGITLPNTVGASAPVTNAGSLRSRGWEISVNWNKRFGDFNFYVNAILSDYTTEVTEWNNPSKTINNNYSGKEYGAIWGFETDRYFEKSDFTGKNADGSWIYASGVADQTGLEQGTFVYGPGDIKFKDLNGDGVINGGKGTADDHGDLTIIGNTQPRYQYSFHLGGDWKGFDFDFYFQGVGKREMWTTSAFVMPLMRGADATYSHMESYNQMVFDADGKITDYIVDQANTYPCLFPGNEGGGTVSGLSSGNHNFYPQDKYLSDMSYLRLKNITLGYTLPKDLTRKAYIQRARVYFSADNMFTLFRGNSDYPLDPELNSNSGNSWGRATPITKSVSVGLQVTF